MLEEPRDLQFNKSAIGSDNWFIELLISSRAGFLTMLPQLDGMKKERALSEIERIDGYLSKHGRGVRS